MASVLPYRNKHDLSDDESGSDSDNDCWKRSRKPEAAGSPPAFPNSSSVSNTGPLNATYNNHTNSCKKRKVNNVWSSVLQEQTMTDVLKDCELKQKPITLQDRNCESYDFRLKYDDPRDALDDEDPFRSMDVEAMCAEEPGGIEEVETIKKHLTKQDVAVVNKIIRVLNERKTHLVYRIVKVIGAEKAMNLLKKTEEAEDNGGIMVVDNSRRRTPGGVYIQLLKADKSLTRKQKDTIFPPEERCSAMRRKFHHLKGKKKKPKKKKKKKMTMGKTQDSMDMTASTITPQSQEELQVEEKVIQQHESGTESSEIEDGEILD